MPPPKSLSDGDAFLFLASSSNGLINPLDASVVRDPRDGGGGGGSGNDGGGGGVSAGVGVTELGLMVTALLAEFVVEDAMMTGSQGSFLK